MEPVPTVRDLQGADTAADAEAILETCPRRATLDTPPCFRHARTDRLEVIPEAMPDRQTEQLHGTAMRAMPARDMLHLLGALGANRPAARRTFPHGATTEHAAHMGTATRRRDVHFGRDANPTAFRRSWPCE